MRISRYLFLPLVIFLSSCADPAPSDSTQAPDGAALLKLAAEAQGSKQLAALHDINVSFSGTWSRLIKRIQPVLTDDGYRGVSEERLLLEPIGMAQRHSGPAGTKQVYRTAGSVAVWRNGEVDEGPESLAAAALVADDYRLFLLGPMFLERNASSVKNLGVATVDHAVCDRLLVILRPGLGNSSEDRIEITIDRATRLARRMRVSLDGLESTQGAVAQIDLSDFIEAHGITWPTHFVESLVKPISGLPIHEWRLTGLDFDRGYSLSDINGPKFKGTAVLKAGSS